MNKIIAIIKSLILSLSLGLLVTTQLNANTADGYTPAEEMVCDVLQADGITKGLYGLCIAYCEATDSPEDLTSDEKIASLPVNSASLLENYNRKRENAGNVDPQMPCATYYDETACPVWSMQQLESLGTRIINDGSGTYSYRDDAEETYGNITYLIEGEWVYGASFGSMLDRAQIYQVFPADGSDPILRGSWTSWSFIPGTGFIDYGSNDILLTQSQYDACEAELRAHIMPIK